MTDAPGQQATLAADKAEKKERNPYLEGILELGRNWALAVAICGAGIAASRAEVVDGAYDWSTASSYTCLGFALLWLVLAVFRFDEVLMRELRSKRVHWISLFVVLVLIALGGTILVGLAKYSDNAAIVKVCESVPADVPSKIHTYNECKRLKAKRDALRARLEGTSTDDHAVKPPADRAR